MEAGETSRSALTDAWISEWISAAPRAVMHPFRPPGDAVEIGDEIALRHFYRIQHHPGVQLAAELNWTEDPFNDRNWQIWFHSLTPVSYLVQAYEKSNQALHLDRAKAIVESWIAAHIDGAREHPMTWHDHAIALRVLVLLEFAEVWRRSGGADIEFARRLLATLHGHGRLLLEPAIYRAAHNHGIEQDRALLSLAMLVPQWPESDAWRQLAWSRLLEQIRAGITPEGAHVEHSPEYEGLVFLMLAQTRDFLVAHGRPFVELGHAVDSLQRKIAFSLRPDGTWPPVGDSVARRSEELLEYLRSRGDIGAEALYALTSGAEGAAPTSSHLVLPGSGCAVFRERWERARQSGALHCYFTAAFHSRTHKHHDDLSLSVHAFGREVLTDAGRYSYNYDDPHRRYCESVHGHNVVIVDGSDTDLRRTNVGKSGMTASFSGKRVVGVDAVHYLYQGVESRRLLLYFPPNILIVFDRLASDHPISALQQFLFAPEWVPTPIGEEGRALRAAQSEVVGGPSVQMVQLFGGADRMSVVRGQGEPFIGWVSRSHGSIEPCSAVHTGAAGAGVVFVTAFVFEPNAETRCDAVGSARWDGRELQCSLQLKGDALKLTFQQDSNRARLLHRGTTLESCVWPTPYEFRTRRMLGRMTNASASDQSVDGASGAGADPPLGGAVVERLGSITAQVEQLELRHRQAVELLNHDLDHLQQGLQSVQDGLLGNLMQRIEEIERARAQLEIREQVLQQRVTAMEENERHLQERLARAQQLAANRLESLNKRQVSLDQLRLRLEKAQQACDESRDKLRRVSEEKRVEHRRFMHAQEQLWDTMNSVRWRLGNAIILAMRPSMDTLKLPIRLVKLVRDGLKRRAERRANELSPPDSPKSAIKKTAAGAAASKPFTIASAGAAQSPARVVTSTLGPSEASKRKPAAAKKAHGLSPAPRRDVRVACILDEFSYECFETEADWRQLSPDGWKREIEAHRPQLLFVESAWRGAGEKWRHLVSTDRRNDDGPLKDVIDYCRAHGIPTVFWNKEDPANYEHFIQSAVWFDHILTTDSDCIERYEKAAGHSRIGVLPFAAQPRIHNPIGRRGGDLGNVCFAGTWYAAKHDGRKEDADIVLAPALSFGLHIYDRMFGYTGPGWQNYQYPPEYQGAIRGGLPYEEMLDAYKRYHIFLNVNSVRTSPTMCSRRVFEILACGTNVISAYAPSLENLLGTDCVRLSRSREETRRHLETLLGDEAQRNRMSTLAVRRVMAEHTYDRRFAQVLAMIGLGVERHPPRIACILPVASVDDAAAARAFVERNAALPIDPHWLLTDASPEIDAPGAVIRAGGNVGAALDAALADMRADTVFIWRRGEDQSGDMLADLYHAFSYYGGDAVCKPAVGFVDQLVYAEATDARLGRSLFRMSAARRLGGAALSDSRALAVALPNAKLKILATDTVGVAMHEAESSESPTAAGGGPSSASDDRDEHDNGNGAPTVAGSQVGEESAAVDSPEHADDATSHDELSISWIGAEGRGPYRFLLRDETTGEYPLKAVVEEPSVTISAPGGLDWSHVYQWKVEIASADGRSWENWVPYTRLRPTPPRASATRIEWKPAEGTPHVYRVIVRNDTRDEVVLKDVVSGYRFDVDWRELNAADVYRYRVQIRRGEAWVDHQPYRSLNPPISILLASRGCPQAGGNGNGDARLLFLFTCDTEVNLRNMRLPERAAGIDHQIFCKHEGREYGINLMMDLLDQHGIKGTFFLDILMEHQFGRAGVERVIEAIATRGHDIQLHLHHSPHLWYSEDHSWRDLLLRSYKDYTPDIFRRVMEHAVDLFELRVGRKAVAFRNGSYYLRDGFIPILREFDICVDSTLYPFKNFDGSDWLLSRTQPFLWEGVLEVPVSWLVHQHKEQSSARQFALRDSDLAIGPCMSAVADTARRPQTIVAMSHSYTLLDEQRTSDPADIAAWNARLRETNDEPTYNSRYIGDNGQIYILNGPDEGRIASMARMIGSAMDIPGAVGVTFQELNDRYFDMLAQSDTPVDPIAVYDAGLRRAGIVTGRKYSTGYLGELEKEFSS